MFKTSRKIFIFIFLAVLFFTACEKEELNFNKNIQAEESLIDEIPEFQIVEGVMVFKNSKDFLKLYLLYLI